MKIVTMAAALGAIALAGPAFAQAGPGGGFMGLPAPDANGVITKASAMAAAEERFAALDANHDGKVSAEEREAAGMRAGPNAPAGDMTLEDFKARAAGRFDRIDTNQDGKIDAAEIAAMRERMRQLRGGAGGPPPAPSGN